MTDRVSFSLKCFGKAFSSMEEVDSLEGRIGILVLGLGILGHDAQSTAELMIWSN